jgi:outer membrane lipoprotein-sorting protein
MKNLKITNLIMVTIAGAFMLLIPLSTSFAQTALTAEQVLAKVDQCVNGSADQEMKMALVLIDKNGGEQTREIIMLQKGSDRRIGKFLSPADQKGIGFLSLPDNVFYIYLPAYKKTRRIASHIKNTKFASTDFTYEDMEAKNYADKWSARLLAGSETQYQLELLLKNNAASEYGKLILWVNKDNFYPQAIEYYDKNFKPYKKMTSSQIDQVNGFWIAKESLMEDLKSGHKTKMLLRDVKFNSGIAADKFSERYLAQ